MMWIRQSAPVAQEVHTVQCTQLRTQRLNVHRVRAVTPRQTQDLLLKDIAMVRFHIIVLGGGWMIVLYIFISVNLIHTFHT